ncbi:MAG: divergent polysaccharide deacetylase family protein [Acidobacteria bacterium]|jgi:polysaccharide deacetylase 2 family uncharacterized protein YibQ|nr:divergent polysaccharide deacetylase family protein [Acidobacteriota bacterium]
MPQRRKKSRSKQTPQLRALALLACLIVIAGAVWYFARDRGAATAHHAVARADFGDRLRTLAGRRGARPAEIDADDPIRRVGGVFVRTWKISLPDQEAVRLLRGDLKAETATWQGRLSTPPRWESDDGRIRVDLEGEAFDIHLRVAGGKAASVPTKPPTAPPRPTERPTLPASAHGRLAILLDDAGQNRELVPEAAALPEAIAVAVLPFLPHSVDTAAELHRTGHEVWLHLPMEPRGYPKENPGPGAILVSMPEREVRTTVRSALNNVPFIVGVNNHMGSLATENLRTMTWVMQEIAGRGLKFLDSRTTAGTVAEEAARAQGIPTGRRNVFLDNDGHANAIERQLDEAIYLARRDGSAIAIGHMHARTLRVLEREAERFSARGVTLVPPSKLLH